jgi:hypothetical protein
MDEFMTELMFKVLHGEQKKNLFGKYYIIKYYVIWRISAKRTDNDTTIIRRNWIHSSILFSQLPF